MRSRLLVLREAVERHGGWVLGFVVGDDEQCRDVEDELFDCVQSLFLRR